jgi:hypothetical protein
LEIAKPVGLLLQDLHFGVEPSVMVLLRVKRHMVAISAAQAYGVSPRETNCATPAWQSW